MHMSSAITDDDLESLGPSTQPSFDASSADTSDQSGTATSNIIVGRVAFSPVSLVINSPPEGSKDLPVRKLGEGGGRARIAVKTYSVDTPSPSKAWNRVVAGFSASLQPLLSPASSQGNGVGSTSPRPPTLNSPPSSLGLSIDEEEETDYGFSPNPHAGKIMLKLPTLTSKGPARSPSLETPCHSILKSPDRPTSPKMSPRPSGIPLTPSSSPPNSSTFSCLSLSPSVLSSPAHLAQIETAPLRACCTNCQFATEEGAKEGYEEGWSKSARKKRRSDMKAMKRAIELLEAGDIGAAQHLVGLPEDEDGDVPISKRQMTKAQVDEADDGKRSGNDGAQEGHDESASGSDEDSTAAPPPSSDQGTQTVRVDPSISPPDDKSSSQVEEDKMAISPTSDCIVPSSASPPPQPEIYEPPPTTPLKPVAPKAKRKFSLSTIGSSIADSARGAAVAQSRVPM